MERDGSGSDRTIPRGKAGRLEQAQRDFRLGNTFAAQGNIEQAIAHYQSACALNPEIPEIYNNLGLLLATQGRTEQAIAHYETALRLKPGYPDAHNNLGNALVTQGKRDLALPHYERALRLCPDHADAHNNLGLLLVALDKADQAISHYERALQLRPDFANAHNNLGLLRAKQGRTGEAVAHYERALLIRPEYADAHNNLGNTLVMQGRTDQAITHYKRALSLEPGYADVHSNLLLTLNYRSGDDLGAIYTAHLEFAKQFEEPVARLAQHHSNVPVPDRPIRIGYVSSDLRQHSVAYFIEPVLEHHDRRRFQIFCYYNSFQEDAVTGRLKSLSDHWRCISGMSDDLAAKQIRDDQIDILIDLNGHAGQNRLPIFARKPAPVQVTWLGYPNTTGLSTIDYRITDGFADPVGMTEHIHSERLVRLPECFSCYKPFRDAPPVSGLPALVKGHVRFGSFNNLAKVTPDVIAVWARILQAIPSAHLCLKSPGLDEDLLQRLLRESFAKWGIAPERLEFLGRESSQQNHLGRYSGIDIGLDPFPYNGTTTTCDALWMGVPVVALAGKAHAGRVGASLLSNLGLTELIADTPEGYIATALRLAAEPEKLNALRSQLRTRMAASPLTDAHRFTKHLEVALLDMWKDWCLKQGAD